MYSEMENGPEIESDFLTALNLLHSTDIESEEKLRKMLDESIAKKYGTSKTLAEIIHSIDTMKDLSIELPSKNEPQKPQRRNIVEISWNDTFYTYQKMRQDIENVIEDDDERMDIPTISIPEEGEGSSAGDGALCKICNGGGLGPLILLECQDCQDVYHPLCHQPPVLDLDIYDPRLVWHCAKCVEVSTDVGIVVASVIEDDNISRIKYPRISKTDQKSKDQTITLHNSEDHLNYFRRNKNQFQLRNATNIGVIRRSSKRQTKTMDHAFGTGINESLKISHTLPLSGSFTSSTLHLRKRVGSKLTMTRVTGK